MALGVLVHLWCNQLSIKGLNICFKNRQVTLMNNEQDINRKTIMSRIKNSKLRNESVMSM